MNEHIITRREQEELARSEDPDIDPVLFQYDVEEEGADLSHVLKKVERKYDSLIEELVEKVEGSADSPGEVELLQRIICKRLSKTYLKLDLIFGQR